jgi:gliding motility-associated-like protein
MKYFNVIIFVGLALQGLSQYCPSLGPDQFLPCGVGTTTLTADLSQCGPGGVAPKQTTDYLVSNIPYTTQTNNGTSIFMTDDSQQGPFNIGFNFCFYGATYSQFYIGSNGWISFSGGQPTTFTSQAIPTSNPLVPKNCIMGPWQDWHPGIGGQIRYQTSGVAPCRKLTVSWVGVPMFSCTGNQGTFHIVIYESTNVIENYIQNKPSCTQWQGGTAVEGIHNTAGTLGVAVPGRNSTAWTANNDAWRWTPNGPVVNPVLTWYQVGNPVSIGTGPSINVTPPSTGASYTCHFVYPICNAGWATCNAFVGLGPDTVFVQPGPPNLPQPLIFAINPTCNSSCDGEIIINPNGGNGVQTISWNGPTGFNPTGLCGGNYTFTITDAIGCSVSGNVTLVNPPIIIANPIISSDTVCYNSNALYTTTDLGPGYTYQWSTVGNLISGQGNDSIIVDWGGFPDGFIPNAVDLIAISPLGCVSLPISFDVTIFNVLPIIDPIGPFCSNEEFVTLSATPVGGVFNGDGVIVNEFHPSITNTPNNTINYTYIQSGCVFDTSINVIVNPQPILSQITPYNDFFEICEGDSIPSIYSVTSTIPGGYNEWELLGNITQSNNFNINWAAPGIFTLSVVNWVNGCPSPQQQTTITIVRCPELLFYLPNAFTPDGDEHNNVFQPVFTSGFDPYNFNLKVYNRWGETIFESNNHLEYWDGTYQLSGCPAGIYTYTLQFKDINNDGKYSFGGHVNLIR